MTVADIRGAKRPAKKASTASKQDLRAWLEALRAAGEVQEISGAEREAEIGGIVDLYMRKMGNPAVLFDDIPGYPQRPPHSCEHSHLGAAHQSNPRHADRRLPNRARLLLAQIYEGGAQHRAASPSNAGRSWRTSTAARM